MSFEIVSNSGQRLLLRPQDSSVQSTPLEHADNLSRRKRPPLFSILRRQPRHLQRWLCRLHRTLDIRLAATVIQQTRRLHARLSIHIYGSWSSPAATPRSVDLSRYRCCRRSPRGSKRVLCFHSRSRLEPQPSRVVHLRNQGARFTGADSSHVTIPLASNRQRNQGRNPCRRIQSADRLRHRLRVTSS